MRNVWLIGAIAVAVTGCGKDDKSGDQPVEPVARKPAAATAPASAAAVDAAPAADPPDEAALRKHRKTGLAAADEKPEVLVEDLVVAIAEGKIDAARFVDPARGYLEHVILPGAQEIATPDVMKRHCGKKAVKALLADARTLVAKQRDGARGAPEERDHVLQCDNTYVSRADPAFGGRFDDDADAITGGHALAYAVCRSGGAAEYDANYELVFVPDEARGLRVVGSLVWESGVATVPWADFADQAVAPGGCK